LTTTARCKLGLCLFTVMLFGITATAAEFTFDYQKLLDVEKPISLTLNYVQGDVTISRSESGRLVIEAVKIVRASNREEAEEVADHIEIKVGHSGDRVTINTNFLRMVNRSSSFWSKLLGAGDDSFGTISYRILLPVAADIELNGSAGSVDITGNVGSVRINTGVAEAINVSDNFGPVSIISDAAHVKLSSIEGELVIQNGSGITRGEFLMGPVTVRQPRGEIDLQWVEGDITVKSQSGKIHIKQLRGAADLLTSSGQVEIETELDSPSQYTVETTSGEIFFSVPVTASGKLDIETRAGEIKTEMPVAIKSMTRNRLEGEFGGGGAKVVLMSSTGDVTVAQF